MRLAYHLIALIVVIVVAALLTGCDSRCFDEKRQLRCEGADAYWRETEPLRI